MSGIQFVYIRINDRILLITARDRTCDMSDTARDHRRDQGTEVMTSNTARDMDCKGRKTNLFAFFISQTHTCGPLRSLVVT